MAEIMQKLHIILSIFKFQTSDNVVGSTMQLLIFLHHLLKSFFLTANKLANCATLIALPMIFCSIPYRTSNMAA